ncbi:MAG: VOC family protein [Saprospiraceae bacterium]
MTPLTLPQPKLGDVTAITITTPDLDGSLKYYQQLGFKELFRADFPFPWLQMTDGALILMLRKDMNPYIALTYYSKEIDKVVAELKQTEISFKEIPTPSPEIKRYLIQSPDGLNISLVTYVDGFSQPAGPTMLSMPQQDYFQPDKYVNKTCGLYGEFAHPVTDLDKSISWWEKLGYISVSKFSSPYPWAIISDGLGVVGLHQTKSFSYPVITFFASDMKDKIDKLKTEGLKNYTESGGGNIVLTTPEGQHINLFKLGM